jgi:integrase
MNLRIPVRAAVLDDEEAVIRIRGMAQRREGHAGLRRKPWNVENNWRARVSSATSVWARSVGASHFAIGEITLSMYLERRRLGWYAVHTIPRPLHKLLGRRFVASLKTHDHATAKVRAAAKEAAWRAEIERVRAGAVPTKDTEFWREALATTPTVDGPDETDLQDVIRDQVIAEARRLHPDDEAAQVRFYKAATGALVPFLDRLDAWAATLDGIPRTTDVKRSTVTEFAKMATYVQDVTPKLVQEWADRLAADGKNPKTIKRKLGEIRGYWTYLQRTGVAPAELLPFTKVTLQRASRRHKKGDVIRRPFTPEDVVKLLEAARSAHDQQLVDLIEIARWSGCRIAECCLLKVTAVDLKALAFHVEDSKSQAGVRQVPIHSKLLSMMQRLVAQSTDGYVISGLTFNQYQDRNNAVGKRFGRLKTRLGYGPEVVFHSLRKTVATLLQNALVPEDMAAAILGHEIQTLSYGLYSGGPALAVKREAIEKVTYPSYTCSIVNSVA